MRAFARAAWAYTRPYFHGNSGFSPAFLLAAVIACQLGFVAAEVARNHWRNDFFQSLQDRDWPEFVRQFWIYLAIATALILTSVYQQYFTQWLGMRWREWLTSRFLDRWLAGGAHYRIRFSEQAGDNPDQRIAEDTRKFATLALSLSVGLLGAIVTLASFVAILWSISSAVKITVGGTSYEVPGLLVWAALLYAVAGTMLAHVIGRLLIPLNYEQDKVEGSFRFGLARVRDNTEEIALLEGDAAERRQLDGKFADILQNWFALIRRQKLLGFFSESYKHASLYFPYLVLAPFYFAGEMQLGVLMQAGSAFATVRTSLSFFVTAYRELTEWIAVTRRLDGLDRNLNEAPKREVALAGASANQGNPSVVVRRLRVLDRGQMAEIGVLDHLDLTQGETAVLHGRSGSGKTSVIRALTGIWPFMDGTVDMGKGLRVLALPQRAYMPAGTLKDAAVYPLLGGDVPDRTVEQALHDVGLGRIACRLHDPNVIDELSGGERQRVCFARVLLVRPDILVLDEATSALEPEAQREMMFTVRRRLPDAAIIVTETSASDALASKILEPENTARMT